MIFGNTEVISRIQILIYIFKLSDSNYWLKVQASNTPYENLIMCVYVCVHI